MPDIPSIPDVAAADAVIDRQTRRCKHPASSTLASSTGPVNQAKPSTAVGCSRDAAPPSEKHLSRTEGGFCMTRRIFAALFCAAVFGLFAECPAGPGSGSVRSPVGQLVQHPGLGPLLSLPVRLLSAKLLGRRILSQLRKFVLPLSARNAHSGVQQAVAQRVSAKRPVG